MAKGLQFRTETWETLGTLKLSRERSRVKSSSFRDIVLIFGMLAGPNQQPHSNKQVSFAGRKALFLHAVLRKNSVHPNDGPILDHGNQSRRGKGFSENCNEARGV